MFGFSYESLDTIGLWAMIGGLIFGVLALALTGISSVSLYTSGKMFQRESAIFQRESAERIAELNHETAQARLETERLRQQIAARRLSEDQINKIAGGLVGLAIPLRLGAMANDPESMQLAIDIRRALLAAEIKVPLISSQLMAGIVVGIIIKGPKNDALRVGRAFVAAGLNVQVKEQAGDLVILVGSKPPPQ